MFLRFAAMKRGQHLKEVDIVINETRELRVTEVRGVAQRGGQGQREDAALIHNPRPCRVVWFRSCSESQTLGLLPTASAKARASTAGVKLTDGASGVVAMATDDVHQG
jgi:hypothetical protein